jgi:hypothetical protein
MAALEAEHADGIEQLLAVPAQLVSRQIDLAVRQFGDGMKQLLEAESRWAEQARERAGWMAQPWLVAHGTAPH